MRENTALFNGLGALKSGSIGRVAASIYEARAKGDEELHGGGQGDEEAHFQRKAVRLHGV